jgi:hypothetical protein
MAIPSAGAFLRRSIWMRQIRLASCTEQFVFRSPVPSQTAGTALVRRARNAPTARQDSNLARGRAGRDKKRAEVLNF